MRIVLDSNIFFSALIKDSLTRKLLVEYEGFFLFPSYIFEEMEKYKADLLTKSRMRPQDFDQLLKLLLKKVLIVPEEVLKDYREEALEIVKNIDRDDALFIACALAYPKSVIWSDDKKLKNQNRVKIISTAEISEYLA